MENNKADTANYFQTVCNEHDWVAVETSNTGGNTIVVQCSKCGILKSVDNTEQGKSAQEILDKYGFFITVNATRAREEMIKAMEEYASQFKKVPLQEEGFSMPEWKQKVSQEEVKEDEQLYRFVKASERLPEKDKGLFVIYEGEKHIMQYSDKWYDSKEKKYYKMFTGTGIKIFEEDYDKIEWLEPITRKSSDKGGEDKINKAIEWGEQAEKENMILGNTKVATTIRAYKMFIQSLK